MSSNERLPGSYEYMSPVATSNHHPAKHKIPFATLSRTMLYVVKCSS